MVRFPGPLAQAFMLNAFGVRSGDLSRTIEPLTLREPRWLVFAGRFARIERARNIEQILGVSWPENFVDAGIRRDAVAEILDLGGQVSYDYETAGRKEPPGSAWLRKRIGNDYFQTATTVGLVSKEFEDPEKIAAALTQIRAAPQHRWSRHRCRGSSGGACSADRAIAVDHAARALPQRDGRLPGGTCANVAVERVER